ncbi:MAG: hypothetical protein LAP21_04165 [Acidobacteriia bacterium]|nr:hypothetical protein [Terriglobia bacterium]
MKKLLQLLLVLVFASAMQAQDTPKPRTGLKFYRVNFSIFELEDGKKINERNYSLPVNSVDGNPRSGTIRVGTRVPITSGEGQVTYIDVGMNIDCDVTEQGEKFILSSSLDITSFALPDQNANPRAGGNPILRQVKQHFIALLPAGKPTLVTSIDDTNSKKRLQVEATVTRVE